VHGHQHAVNGGTRLCGWAGWLGIKNCCLCSELRRQWVDGLPAANLPSPRAGLEHEADAALEKVACLDDTCLVAQTHNAAIEIVGVPAESTGWQRLASGPINIELTEPDRIMVNEDELVKQRLKIEFLNAQIIALAGPPGECRACGNYAFGSVPDV